MLDLVRSLPQGVFWYPLVLALAFIAARTVLGLVPRRREPAPAARATTTPLLGYAHLIQRAATDTFAQGELERVAMGLLLQASGYRGYSVDACRAFMAQETDDALVALIAAHLGDDELDGAERSRLWKRLLDEVERRTED